LLLILALAIVNHFAPDGFLRDHPSSNTKRRQDLVAETWTGDETVGSLPIAELPCDIGKYRVEDLIDVGGMGAVYRACDTTLDRTVAIKFPKFQSQLDASALERFHREAKSMASVTHSNLCPIHDVGIFGEIPYFAMTFVEGVSLDQALKSQGKFAPREAVAIIRKLALAAAAMAEKNVVHRDLKLANVILTDDQEPIILDFGLAIQESQTSRVTQTGVSVGTPAYMSPEQVEGNADMIGPATDVYSLGIMLFELLTGRLPFKGSPGAMMAQILRDDPPSLTSIDSEIEPKLDQIFLKATRKDSSHRCTAREFATMLEETYDLLLASSTTALPSQSLTKPRTAQRKTTALIRRLSVDSKRRKFLLIGLASLLLGGCIFAGIVIIIRDKDGKERRIEVPEGGSLTIVDEANKTPPTLPVAPMDEPPAPVAITKTEATPAEVGDVPRHFPVKELETDQGIFKVFFHPRHDSYFTYHGRGVKEIDFATGEVKRSVSIRQGGFKYSPKGNYLIQSSGVGASKAMYYSPIRQVGEQPKRERVAKFKDVNGSALLSPDGIHLVSRTDEGWYIYTASPEKQLATLEGESITPRAFSADGSLLVGLSEQEILIWEIPSGKLIQSWKFEINDPKQAVRFLSNEQLITTLDGQIVIVEKGRVLQQWKPHEGKFRWDTSLHRERIITWQNDQSPIVWNAQGQAIATLVGEGDNGIGWLDIHPDGTKALSLSKRRVRVWDLP